MDDSNGYKLINDPSIVSIPIIDNGDPLIDYKDQSVISFSPYPKAANNTDYTKLRSTVYNKLVEAQSHLPDDLKFCVYEGYRSIKFQGLLFEQYYEQVKRSNPGKPEEWLISQATNLVSPVLKLDETKHIPPHATGGAVDVYLIDKKGVAVDMGIMPQDWVIDVNVVLTPIDSPYVTDVARYHRSVMYNALSKVGFINFPTGYWHWSYGDRYWAYETKNPYALYGAV